MKNHFVSILAAIALSAPLGIGGLLLAAPGTATDAEAQSFLQPRSGGNSFLQPQSRPDALDLLRQYQDARCTVHQLWYCDASVVQHVAGEFQNLFNYFAFEYSVAFPIESNGANQITFDALVAEVGVGTQQRRDLIERYLRTVFSDRDVDPAFDHVHQGTGYIHPVTRADWRRQYGEEYDREIQALRDRQAFINHCQHTRRGDVLAAAEGRSISCVFRVRYTNTSGNLVSVRRKVYFDELGADPTAFQITPIEPLGSLAEIEDIESHQQATSDNRARIVELQEEVIDHEDRLVELEPAVARNTQIITALGNSVGVLSEAVTDLAEKTEKNTAGIALAYALDAPGLSYGKRYAITGALGQFRGESAVGFSGSFKAGENMLISVGGGFAGSGDSSVTGGKVSATFEW